MDAPRRIVVGADLSHGQISEGSLLAIEHARRMAFRTGAHVTLLHSNHLDEHWDPTSRRFEHTIEQDTSEERAPLDAALGALRDEGIDADCVVTNGAAGIEIIKCVLEERADIVIVGKRSHSETDGRRLGSISQNVVRYCPCPVLVVKPGSSPTPAVIVAASDRTEVGGRVVNIAASIAARCDSVLHAIHAIQVDLEVQMSGDEARDAHVHEEREQFKAEVEAEVAAAGFKGEVQTHAGVTCPTHGVLEAEQRLQPDLIVMGTVSRTGLPGLVMGNTAERLLGSLDTSLLVIKPADFRCPLELD